MAETNIPVAAAQAPAATTTVGVKTFNAVDPTGTLVQVQAVALVDEFGRLVQAPMTEATGQQILSALVSINNLLSEYTGCGTFVTFSTTTGSP